MRLSCFSFSHSGRFTAKETYFGDCLLGAAAGIQKPAWNHRPRENHLALAGTSNSDFSFIIPRIS
jgi:hypothetical protein